MKKLLVSVLLLFAGMITGFGQGITFFSGNYKDALSKAKRENKAIFVDVYTSWCGPCKMMAKNVFTDKAVGDYFNRNFISLKLDAEKEKDHPFFANYKASSFPSYFWLNASGELIHTAGGSMPADKFIELSKNAMQSDFMERSKALKARWDKGERTPQMVYEYIDNVVQKSNPQQANDLLMAYLDSKTEKELLTKDNYSILMRTIRRDSVPADKYGTMVLKNADVLKGLGEKNQYWIDMYRSIVRTASMKYNQDKNDYNKYVAQISGVDFKQADMYNKLMQFETKIFEGKFNEVIPQILPLVEQFGPEHQYLYAELFYTLIIGKYFTDAPCNEEELKTVLALAQNAMKYQPCKQNLIYIAGVYMKMGDTKQACNVLASMPFFGSPMLSNALYRGLGLEFYGKDYR
ncbi:MAG: thioredoxin family protein [Marinifilaceae bacterium]